jgi:hypothetical protein
MLIRENDKVYKHINGEWVLCGVVKHGDYRKEIKNEMGHAIAINIGEIIEWTI